MTILVPGANCMGIYEATETGVLVDAADYYRAFHQAASQARHYILLAGWQFDSDVRLLRGADNPEGTGEVRFIRFLEELCEKTPELEIYLLAWDFSAFFALEREWFQDLIFNWSSHERIHFRFDNVHAAGATHHQKFAIIDGQVAFVGGMDICSSRWDDRAHLETNPDRIDVNGSPYGSYHDIQSYQTGPVVKVLLDIFVERWIDSGAPGLTLPTADLPISLDLSNAFPMPVSRVAVSRTRAVVPKTDRREVFEIRRLFIDAIMAADKLIYLENQYFSSQAIYWSLISRMALPNRPRLQIVMMLPDRLPPSEEVFLGLPQVKMVRSLQQVAEKTGHVFSVYSSTALIDDGTRKMTFIHSKLLLVDDRFLTVGSANATNRSMGLDTELNVSWEADDSQPELVNAIRTLRCSLLAEHAGLLGSSEEDRFETVDDLTTRLDTLADDHRARLCRYTADPALVNSDWPETLEPVGKIVDPDHPVDSEFVFEILSKYETAVFAKGILKLSKLIIGI
ncbi:phospholipase D-like domain-containing protein [Geomonas sp.]|uniref:phospholipase D-like domain-containing protein n=1 Tax=Geomonas sp. TaxID=2651584 RepID=UPI002B466DE1|nr:phospholipase D-like domain-containing protein [Geomonas sp.]HJV35047.1 phospholipase D-like domain-containing protein [Geomonas sp.]